MVRNADRSRAGTLKQSFSFLRFDLQVKAFSTDNYFKKKNTPQSGIFKKEVAFIGVEVGTSAQQ